MSTIRKFALLVLVVFIGSCVDDLDFDKFSDISPQPNLLLPAVDLTLKLEDLVAEDSILTQDPDGFLRFVYEEDSLFAMNASEFVSIPSQEPFAIPDFPLFPDTTVTFTFDAGLASLGSMELNQMVMERMGISWSLSTQEQSPVNVAFIFNNALVNGQPLTVNAQNNGAGDFSDLEFFNDVAFDLTQSTNPSAPPFNNLSLTIAVTTGPGIIPGANFVTVGFGIDSTQLSSVNGYFGQRPVNVPAGTFDLDLGSISEFTSGFTLTDPRMTFKMDNGMGVSMGVALDLDGVNTDGDLTQLNPPAFDIAQPSTPGTSLLTNFEMNSTNSNIVGFLDALPTSLIYSGQMTLNPNNTGGTPNFLTNQDVLQVGMEIELPMELRTSDLSFEDDIEMGISDEEDAIRFLALNFRSENGFPFSLDVTLYFLDSSMVVQDSVLMPLLIPATIDQDGRAIQPSINDIEILLTEAQLNRLVSAPYWRIKGKVQTPDDGTTAIKLYADYDLRLQLAVKGRVKVTAL